MTQNIAKRKSVDFQGAIEVVGIEGVFQLLYLTSLSGKLILLRPPDKASFYFSNGKLLWGTLHTQQKQIGQMLLDSQQITDEQLKECLKEWEAMRNQKRVGSIMIEKGYLQRSTLNSLLRQQAKDAFFDALHWKDGSFAFISDMNAPDEDIVLNERIDHLLLEGFVRIENSGFVPS
ncbi:MAG: DUF4388 domain-containing protein [Desulfobulbaceae bacterium]|nr:MAG: DUF4388 domain-containing protein [Desulfobulbaceae bacterium]